MPPEHLKFAAIGFAVLSVTCLAWAGSEWGRSAWHGGWILLAVSIVLLSVLWGLAEPLGWGRDRVLWVGFGVFLAIMTVTRPSWFWDNHRARWLRELIGDEPTTLLYLLLAGVMLWVGLFTDWSFGRRF